MDGLKIVLMLLMAFFTFKAIVKGAEIVKARELVKRSFLMYILGIILVWWLFQTLDFENRFFWQGMISGGIFWTISLVTLSAEKIGDLPRHNSQRNCIGTGHSLYYGRFGRFVGSRGSLCYSGAVPLCFDNAFIFWRQK